MKIRSGFVSNSSSSSFVMGTSCEFKNIFDIAKYMISCRGWEHSDSRLINTINDAEADGMNPDTPIHFLTSNYDTYIALVNDEYVIATCKNHDFDDLDEHWGDTDIAINILERECDNVEYWHPDGKTFGKKIIKSSYCSECCIEKVKDKEGNVFCPSCGG